MDKILKIGTDVSNAEFFDRIGDLKRANEAIEIVAVVTEYNNRLIQSILNEME